MSLNTETWLPFKIGQIFKTYTGGDLIITDTQEGEIPIISHTSDNNGIKTYSAEIEGQKLFNHKKTISLADRGTFYAAVQYQDFYIGTRVKALEFLDGEHSTEVLIFVATVINHEKFRFCYGRNCTNGLDELIIYLPAVGNKPDYLFMKNYICSLNINIHDIPDYFLKDGYKKACWYLDNINQEAFEKEYAGKKQAQIIKLSDRKWKTFRLASIFKSISNSQSYNVSDLVAATDGVDYIPYISRTNENNGISMYVQATDYSGIEKANAITIGDTTATIFYQERDFITGPHIIVIRADWLNVYTATFIITLLNQEKYRYPVFGRAFTKDLIKETLLYLPVDEKGTPDFVFMEKYVKSLPFSAKI